MTDPVRYHTGKFPPPMFYLSEYLEANRQEYCDRLLAVSRDDDWTEWCCFFLQAIQKQAAENESKARKILELYQRRKDWIVDRTHSQFAIRALDFWFGTPIFNASDCIKQSRVPPARGRRILTLLSGKKGLLRTLREGGGRRPAVFVFAELRNVAEGRTIFGRSLVRHKRICRSKDWRNERQNSLSRTSDRREHSRVANPIVPSD